MVQRQPGLRPFMRGPAAGCFDAAWKPIVSPTAWLFADMDAIFGAAGATSGPAELLAKQQEAAAEQVG